MFDSLNDLLMQFLSGGKKSNLPVPLPVPKKTFLPEIEITPKLQTELDKAHLEFLTKLFMSANKDLNKEQIEWFIQEIAIFLQYAYPNLPGREYELILQQIIDMARKEIRDK
jgi:hypothetical protein